MNGLTRLWIFAYIILPLAAILLIGAVVTGLIFVGRLSTNWF